MIKTFQIDYVRAVLENELSKFANDTKYFNDCDIHLFSFYEHLVENEEVERYVEYFKDLISQQNRKSVIGYGILATTDTPAITNVMDNFVSPFEWSCTIRCTMGNRDKMLGTLYKIIENRKGKKVDIAQLDNGKLVVVNSITDELTDFCYVGDSNSTTPNIDNMIEEIEDKGIEVQNDLEYVFLSQRLLIPDFQHGTSLMLYKKVNNVWTLEISYGRFEKYKLSLSFDDIKCDEPYTLDAQEYCNITFSGSATLVSASVRLGNDLTRVKIAKYKVITSDSSANDYYFNVSGGVQTLNWVDLDPLDIPSGANANSFVSQLKSNYFKANSHTDSVSFGINYDFLIDMDNELIKQWFNYGRYGENNLTNVGTIQDDSITPNIIYKVKEYWCSWGNVEVHEFKAKIVEDIDIQNTESDTMTLGISLQIQGDNF